VLLTQCVKVLGATKDVRLRVPLPFSCDITCEWKQARNRGGGGIHE
jgi:hypothetical protein